MATKITREEALRALRADYYADVREAAEQLAKEAKAEGWNREALYDRVHEYCDGHHRVIYTARNFEVLLCSDNHNAHSEDFGGSPPLTGDDNINWAALAFSAFHRDVMDALAAGCGGIDVEADDLGSGAES